MNRQPYTILMLLLTIATNTMGQNVKPKKGVAIDFLKIDKGETYKTVKYKDSFFVVIENINLNLYKVEGTLSQEKFNTDMPNVFSGVKLPAFLNLGLPTPKNDIQIAAFSSPGGIAGDKRAQINTELKVIEKANECFKQATILNNEFMNLYNTCNETYANIETRTTIAATTFVGTPFLNRTVQATDIKNKLDITIDNAITAKRSLEGLLLEHLFQVHSQKRKTQWMITEWEQSGVKLNAPGYNVGYTKYKNDKEDLALLIDYEDSLKNVVSNAIEIVKEMEKFRNENKVQALVDNYNKINEYNFTYYSDAIEVDGDELKTDFVITAINPLSCSLPRKVTIKNSYRVSGGLKVDFSTGVFTNGGSEDFLGRELYYKTTDSTHVTIASKDAGRRLMLSVGGLMHIYWRTGKALNVAISPGISVPTSVDGLNFHLGLSALIGRSERLVLSGGLTLRDVKILDRNYTLNTLYVKSGLPEDVPMIKTFPKTGWFFSLTYNWSKLKKQA